MEAIMHTDHTVAMPISEDILEDITNNRLKEPCPCCRAEENFLAYIGVWMDSPNKILLGCESCDIFFLLDANTGYLHKQDYSLSLLRSLQNGEINQKFKCQFFEICKKTIMEYLNCVGICAGNFVSESEPEKKLPGGSTCPHYEQYAKKQLDPEVG